MAAIRIAVMARLPKITAADDPVRQAAVVVYFGRFRSMFHRL